MAKVTKVNPHAGSSFDDFLKEDGVLVVEVGNSMIHLEAQFPDVPFTWVEFENGGHGVFVMSRADLVQYQDYFAIYKS